MALKRIRQTPGLGGHGLAKAGLIVGYVSLTLCTVAIIVVGGMLAAGGRNLMKEIDRQAREQRQFPTPPSVEPVRTGPESSSGPIDTTPDPAGWTLDLSGTEIPSTPVSGRIHGQPFKMDKLTCLGGFLKFQQGSGFIADLEMDVVPFVSLEKLPGKTFAFNPDKAFGMRPHVYAHWKEAGKPKQQFWMKDYALRLEFGQVQNGKIPGKIYLCVPDAEKSFIRGTFEVPAGG